MSIGNEAGVTQGNADSPKAEIPRTIVGVIKEVLSNAEPMTVDEVYDQITKRLLYPFKAADPRT